MTPHHAHTLPYLPARPDRGQSGFSLVELMVALALSMIIVFAVFYAWNSLSQHETSQARKSLLEAEAQRMGRAIVSDIRRASSVLSIGQNRISIISGRTNDTLTYERDVYNNGLLRNGAPMPMVAPNAQVSEFWIIQENGTAFASDSGLLITMRISLRNGAGDTSTLSFKVSVRNPPVEASGIKGWNF